MITREEYFPFGETSFGSFGKKRYRYNGKERDEESGLYYYGARYYATWTCRFISIDPLAGQMPFSSPNSYAANNPVVLVDVDGLAPDGGGGGKEAESSGSQDDQSQDSLQNERLSRELLVSQGYHLTGVSLDESGNIYEIIRFGDSEFELIGNNSGNLVGLRPTSSNGRGGFITPDGSQGFWDGLKTFGIGLAWMATGPIGQIYKEISAVNDIVSDGDYSAAKGLAIDHLLTLAGPLKEVFHGGMVADKLIYGDSYDRSKVLTEEGMNFLLNLLTVGLVPKGGKTPKSRSAGGVMYESPATAEQAGPRHHIATNKNTKSEVRGGPWTQRFKKIFDKAGLDLNGEYNKVNIPDHIGPHPEVYHRYVYERLTSSVEGLKAHTAIYKEAVLNTLNELRLEAETPGTNMNNWILRIF